MNKSIDQQIKELREALGDATMKAASIKSMEAAIKAEDMEVVKATWELQFAVSHETLHDTLSRALGILNGEVDGAE